MSWYRIFSAISSNLEWGAFHQLLRRSPLLIFAKVLSQRHRLYPSTTGVLHASSSQCSVSIVSSLSCQPSLKRPLLLYESGGRWHIGSYLTSSFRLSALFERTSGSIFLERQGFPNFRHCIAWHYFLLPHFFSVPSLNRAPSH